MRGPTIRTTCSPFGHTHFSGGREERELERERPSWTENLRARWASEKKREREREREGERERERERARPNAADRQTNEVVIFKSGE